MLFITIKLFLLESLWLDERERRNRLLKRKKKVCHFQCRNKTLSFWSRPAVLKYLKYSCLNTWWNLDFWNFCLKFFEILIFLFVFNKYSIVKCSICFIWMFREGDKLCRLTLPSFVIMLMIYYSGNKWKIKQKKKMLEQVKEEEKEGIFYLFTEIIKAVKSLIATLISIKFLEWRWHL